MKRPIERERSRIVAGIVLASLAQDTCLLVCNTAQGVSVLFNCVSTSFGNYAKTFGWLFNDQASKYQALTDRQFTGDGELADTKDEEEED